MIQSGPVHSDRPRPFLDGATLQRPRRRFAIAAKICDPRRSDFLKAAYQSGNMTCFHSCGALQVYGI